MPASNDLVKSFLSSLEGSYASQFKDAVAEVNETATEVAKKSTIATRKQAWVDAIQTLDLDTLEKLDSDMSTYVDQVVTIDTDTPRSLEHEEIVSLMQEYIRFEAISEFLATRREKFKELAFLHLDQVAGPGEAGAIAVPSLGRQFKREGGGRGEPTLNLEKLIKELGEDAGKVVQTVTIPEEVIPAHEETVFNEEALMKLVQEDPSKMAAVKAALEPGKEKVSKFIVRNLS